MERRIKIAGLIFIVLFALLVLRLGQLQLIYGEEYTQLAEGNRIEYRPEPASRGRIYIQDDREPTIAVSNRLAYTVSVIPGNIPLGKVEEVSQRLGNILQEDPLLIREKIQNAPRNTPLRIKRNITSRELLLIEESMANFPGVIIERTPIRDYVYGSLASHLFGYVGEISQAELNHFFTQGYRPGDLIGKLGIERQYERFLRGEDGIRQIEVDSRRIEVNTIGIKPPESGADIFLHLDLTVQQFAEQALKEKVIELQEEAKEDPDLRGGPTGGAFIAMEAQTGKILAMASYPNFDLNIFAGGIDRLEWERLQNDLNQPFLDRTIQITPSPGSIFKVVSGLAVLEEYDYAWEDEITSCSGEFSLGEQLWKCWMDDGHGELDFYEAVAHSCNVSFYKWGYELYQEGSDIIQQVAREFGFGNYSGIDLPGEKEGMVPDAAAKRERRMGPWVPGDMVNLAIGQGDMQATPLQLLNMINTVGNDGKLMQPQIVERVQDNEGRVLWANSPRVLNEVNLEPGIIEKMQQALKDVTEYGTGQRGFGDFTPRVAGKTGTAQTVPGRPNHGWFAGFVPADEPEISIIVFLEYGDDSAYAVDVARDFLEKFYPQEEGSEE